ncbi:MAG: EAL domain-containing response regulator [Solirubrobacterales bacterium]
MSESVPPAATISRPRSDGVLRVVLVEDNPADRRLFEEMVVDITEPRFEVTSFVRLGEALEHLDREPLAIACVVLDLSLPDAEGIDAINRVRQALPATAAVVLTGREDEELALAALQAGAQDYLTKDRIDTDTVRRAVRYAVERMSAEVHLGRLVAENELILESVGEGICGIDGDGRITFINPTAASLLGRERDELVGVDCHAALHGDSHPEASCPILKEVAGQRHRQGIEDSFVRGTGGRIPVQRTINPIDSGEGAVVSFSDLTERKRFESQLRHAADHDALTSLYNRRYFEQQLEREIALASRYGTGGALLLLDLDDFKAVNDIIGHRAGDQLLRSAARLLDEALSDTDVVARLGGDEFGILASNTEVDQAREIGEELIRVMRDHAPMIGRQPLRTRVSIGATMLDREELTSEELLIEAEVAMYEAKQAGGDRLAFFRPGVSLERAGGRGLGWSERIRKALEEDRFTFHAQPIYDLAAGEFTHLELLLRMVDADGELVPPGEFIPAAERFGLIQTLDGWMVGQAAKLAARARDAGRPQTIEVNLSGVTIGDPEMPEVIKRAIEDSGCDPGALVFEITETAAVADLSRAKEFAERIRSLGCAFALDDFGAGFGSFYYLKYFPLDYLKIDGEFVKNLPTSEIDQRMVRAMVEVARGLELKTIAEFIEEEESVEMLKSYGVDYGQGFHLARPAPIPEDWPEGI